MLPKVTISPQTCTVHIHSHYPANKQLCHQLCTENVKASGTVLVVNTIVAQWNVYYALKRKFSNGGIGVSKRT
jgi:hypothetical protein